MTNREWVIDTNVLISAALSSQGVPATLVRFALSQRVLVFSPPTFEELRERLNEITRDEDLSKFIL